MCPLNPITASIITNKRVLRRPCRTSSLHTVTDSIKARKRYEQTPPEEIISQLQLARQDLVVKRNEMERKIAGLHESMRLAKLEKEKLARETDEERQAREREDAKLMTKLLRPK
jgi:hypothetical protein